MKQTLYILMLGFLTIALPACSSGLGDFQDGPPYTVDRTATHSSRVVTAPPVVEPVLPTCPPVPVAAAPDCSAWKNRALKAEAEAAANLEAARRVDRAHSESLRK